MMSPNIADAPPVVASGVTMNGMWPSLRRRGETGTRKPQSFAFGRGLGTAIVLTLAFWGLVAAFLLG